jgi:hypothetical protein
MHTLNAITVIGMENGCVSVLTVSNGGRLSALGVNATSTQLHAAAVTAVLCVHADGRTVLSGDALGNMYVSNVELATGAVTR